MVELLQKTTEIAKATSRTYGGPSSMFDLQQLVTDDNTVYPYHLAVALLSEDEFERPQKLTKLQTRSRTYLSELLEEAGCSLDVLWCLLWKYAVRLLIREGYNPNEICIRCHIVQTLRWHMTELISTWSYTFSVDLIRFLSSHCMRRSYQIERSLNYLLSNLINDRSLSVVMKDYSLAVERVVEHIG